jgi:hypothetical protein
LSEIIAITSGKNVDESISTMTERVRRLCNLISYKCKKGYIPIYNGYLIKYKNGHSAVRGEASLNIWSDEDLELDANEITGIDTDPKYSMYQHFSRSFIALLSYDDNITVIKELHQILEENQLTRPHLTKYKYLRDGLSHGDPLRTSTLNEIKKYFGEKYFVFKNGKFDYNSPINIHNLRIEAWSFMREMLKEYRKIVKKP